MGIKTILASTVLGGAVLLGTGPVIDWAGGTAITGAESLITKQAEQITAYNNQQKGLVSKIQSLQAELNTLITSGSTDTKKITALTAEIAQLKSELTTAQEGRTAAETAYTQLEAQYMEQQDELNNANAEAVRLQTKVNSTTAELNDKEALSEGEYLAIIADNTVKPGTDIEPTPPIVEDVIPEGYKSLKMIVDTPQLVYSSTGVLTTLTINKTVGEPADLIITNTDPSKDYTAIIDGQSYTIPAGGEVNLGTIASLDKKKMVITRSSGTELGKYYLTAE